MINANYIDVNEFETFRTIIREKQNPRRNDLINIEGSINELYTEYIDNFKGMVDSTAHDFNLNQKGCLMHCYDSRTPTFKLVRDRIFNEQPAVLISFCPYCLLDSPKTLDHYINKAEYQEYSTLIRNLIPCCYDCNQVKGVDWRLNENRLFIHFYEDTFIQYRFLHFSIDNNFNCSFKLLKPDEITIEQFEIVENHFRKLELLERYLKRSNDYTSTELRSIHTNHQLGISIPVIIQTLESKLEAKELRYGLNYWQCAIDRGIVSNLSELIENL